MAGGGEGNISVLGDVGELSFEGVGRTGVGGDVGEMRRIWAGFVDDVFGVKKTTTV